MDFGMILKELKKGVKVRRRVWEEESYIQLVIHNNYLKSWFCFHQEKTIKNYRILNCDILSNDWDVFMENEV